MVQPSKRALARGHSAHREAVLTKAVVKAADRLGISQAVLGRTLGLSQATISRMRDGRYQLKDGSKEFELAALFLRLYRGLDAITAGDETSARSWLGSRNEVLGSRPEDLISTVQGLVATVSYVDSRRAPL